MVHSSDLQGEAIIVGFQGPYSSSQEFLDVFLSDIPGVPPNRDIDLAIDLEPGTKPISIPTYRMAPAELKELKDQLQDLLNLTFEEEPIAIFARQVRKLSTKEIASVKVQWKHRSAGEATWETESDMRARYPQLFEAPGVFFHLMFEDEHNF
nr:uncharacterized protein LOC112941861 [Solanum lycopersicum]